MRLLRARDWIEKMYLIGQRKDTMAMEEEMADVLSSERLKADMEKSRMLLGPVVKVLSGMYGGGKELGAEVQRLVMEGGRASVAKELLDRAKGMSGFHTSKLRKMYGKYEEWAGKVRQLGSDAKAASMAHVEQLIEDGMYLYLYEDENERLTAIHSTAEQWREDSRAVIIASSSRIV